MDLSQLFNGEHWFDPYPGPPSTVAYSVLAFVFAMLLGAGVFAYISRGRLFGDNRFKTRLLGQMGIQAIIIGAVGLVLVVCRFLEVPFLSMRLFTYLTVIILIIYIGYYAYYLLRVMPGEMVAYEAGAIRRKYLPKPVTATPRSSRGARKKGRRRK